MTINVSLTTKPVSGLFLGNPLAFSDTIVKLADAELSCLGFTRAASLRELLFIDDEKAHSVGILVVDEALLDELVDLMAQLRAKFVHAHIALAYRTDSTARELIGILKANPSFGQVGLLPMQLQLDSWLSVLRLLVCGENYVPADLLTPAAPALIEADVIDLDNVEAPAPQDIHLTDRELEVLRSAAEGKQNKIIADELKLSQHTVKLHMHHVMAKLGLHNRTEAAVWYLGHFPQTKSS